MHVELLVMVSDGDCLQRGVARQLINAILDTEIGSIKVIITNASKKMVTVYLGLGFKEADNGIRQTFKTCRVLTQIK